MAASVAIYMFMVGVAALVCGPASDRFGRKAVFLVSSVAFLASSIICIFAPSIAVLVAFRALQGFAGEILLGITGRMSRQCLVPKFHQCLGLKRNHPSSRLSCNLLRRRRGSSG